TTVSWSTLNNKSIDRFDFLFMVDNSWTMGDKQQIFAATVPDLVRRFVSPNCVDANGTAGTTPDDPTAPCPSGFLREFAPIEDIHIAIITSSLGGHGSTTCEDQSSQGQND